MTRTWKQLFIPIFLLQAAFFLFVCRHRFIDGDEGFYLLASRLVMQHRAPYLDFFYTQAPLLPYIYAVWFKLTGVSWVSARTFCALQTTILGTLIYWHVASETRKWLAGLCAVVLFATSSLIFCWYPIVKTFPLSALFLFPCYMILTRPSLLPSGRWLALAGFLFGLSVDTRSYVVGVAPVLLWWILRRASGQRLKRLLWSLGGFIVGTVPSLILFFASPDAFLFNNLGYHAMRSGSGLIGNWQDKLLVVAATFGGRFTGFQFSVLTLGCLAFVFFRRMKPDSSLLAFWIALVLGFVSALPTPASMQYFSLIVPFMIVANVCSASDYLTTLPSGSLFRIARAVAVVLLVGFVGAAIPSFRQYLFTGDRVPGILGMKDAPNWTLEQVTAVSQAIDQLTTPGEPVVSYWPGYLFASHADPYPGYENDFGMYVARRLTADKRDKYHILTPAAMMEDFVQHRPRIAVIGNQGSHVGGPEIVAVSGIARDNGYSVVRTIGHTRIFQCCSQQ